MTGVSITLYKNLGKLVLIRGHLNRDLNEIREQKNMNLLGKGIKKRVIKASAKTLGEEYLEYSRMSKEITME